MGQAGTTSTPRISMRLYDEKGRVTRSLVHLIRTPDGRMWAYPEPPAPGKNPDLRIAYELDPSLIEEIPSGIEGEKRYLYRNLWPQNNLRAVMTCSI